MHIADTFTIRASIQTVWDFFLDVERMGRCIPGVESIEAIDDRTYRGRLKVKVGPVAASFDGIVTLTEIIPPHQMVASVEAEDKDVSSAVKVGFRATLSEVDSGTEVAYETDVNLRGRLGQFGSAVVSGTAKKMTAQFVENVRTELES